MNPKVRKFGKAVGRLLGPFIGLGLVVGLFAFLAGDLAISSTPPFFSAVQKRFLSLDNFKTVSNQTAIIGTAGVGMTLIIVGGGIDLSVGSLLALCAVTIALVFRGEFYSRLVATVFQGSTITAWIAAGGITAFAGFRCVRAERGRGFGLGIIGLTWLLGYVVLSSSGGLAAAGAGLAIGALAGFFNGYLITTSRVVPFIVTLGAMEAFRGLAQLLAGGQSINVPDELVDASPWFRDLMNRDKPPGFVAAFPNLADTVLVQSRGVYLMVVAGVLFALVLRFTTLGRYFFAVGSNEKAARLSGLPISQIKWAMYSLAGLMAGLAAVMSFSRLNQADSTAGIGLELRAIAAVVIGGGSLRGGEGSIFGTFIGAFTMAFMQTGCDLAGIPIAVQKILIGCIIVLAVAMDELRHRRQA